MTSGREDIMENSKKSRSDLKKYFVRNAMPTASHFAELIDAGLNQRDDGLAKPAGEPLSLEASATGTRTALRIFESFADVAPVWTVDLVDATSKRALVIGDGASARLTIDRASGGVSVGALSVGGALRANDGLTISSAKPLVVEGLADLGVVRRRPAQFKVEGVKSSFYPVVFQDDGWADGPLDLEISRANIHTDSQWSGSLVARFHAHGGNFGHGSEFDAVELFQHGARFVARFGTLEKSAVFVVWLRGATTYFWRANHNVTIAFNDAKAANFGEQTLEVLNSIDAHLDLDRVIIGPAASSTTCRSGLTVAGGSLSVGTSGPVARLDVAQSPRTMTHPTAINGAYITGDFGPDSSGVEIRHTNGTQGIGLGFNTIYATGSNADQDLGLKARGAGTVRVVGSLTVGDTVTAKAVVQTSDLALKRDVEPLGPALGRVQALRAVRFAWKGPEGGSARDIGLIAQEVEAVFPELVAVDRQGVRGIDYSRLVAPLIAAVQELSAEVEALRSELRAVTHGG